MEYIKYMAYMAYVASVESIEDVREDPGPGAAGRPCGRGPAPGLSGPEPRCSRGSPE